jgi:uncharacterized membrane protein
MMSDTGIRWSGWLGAALFVSIAVNTLLAGVVLGRETPWLADRPQPAGPPSFPVEGFAGRVQKLSEDEQRRFALAMRPYRPGIREARVALAEARQRLDQQLVAEPYSLPTTLAALAEVRAKTTVLQQRVQEAAAEALVRLSPASRRTLASPTGWQNQSPIKP